MWKEKMIRDEIKRQPVVNLKKTVDLHKSQRIL
jgi:hypothetical protein